MTKLFKIHTDFIWIPDTRLHYKHKKICEFKHRAEVNLDKFSLTCKFTPMTDKIPDLRNQRDGVPKMTNGYRCLFAVSQDPLLFNPPLSEKTLSHKRGMDGGQILHVSTQWYKYIFTLCKFIVLLAAELTSLTFRSERFFLKLSHHVCI